MIKLTQGQLPAGQGATYNAPMTLNIFVQDANKFQTITAVVQAGEVKEMGEEKKEYFQAYGNVASYEIDNSKNTDFLTVVQPQVLESLQKDFPTCEFEIV